MSVSEAAAFFGASTTGAPDAVGVLGVEVAPARPTGRGEHLEPNRLLRVAVDAREHRTVRAARHERGVERVVCREDRGQVGSGRPERCVRGAHRLDEGRCAIGLGDALDAAMAASLLAKAMIDVHASSLGHAHPVVAEAIAAQARSRADRT